MLKIKEITFNKSSVEDSILVKSIQERNSPSKQIIDQFQEYDKLYHSLGPE